MTTLSGLYLLRITDELNEFYLLAYKDEEARVYSENGQDLRMSMGHQIGVVLLRPRLQCCLHNPQ